MEEVKAHCFQRACPEGVSTTCENREIVFLSFATEGRAVGEGEASPSVGDCCCVSGNKGCCWVCSCRMRKRLATSFSTTTEYTLYAKADHRNGGNCCDTKDVMVGKIGAFVKAAKGFAMFSATAFAGFNPLVLPTKKRLHKRQQRTFDSMIA